MFEAVAIKRDRTEASAGQGLAADDSILAPLQLFERPLSLLRITNAQISLLHVRFRGEGAMAAGSRLRRMFDREAMIEPLADGSFALLFVRRGEDGAALTARVLRTLRGAMDVPAFERRGRLEITAVHRRAGTVGEVEDLIAELTSEVANGSSIIAP